MANEMSWSFGRNKYDNRPVNHHGNWDDFVDFISTHRARAKGLNYITSPFGGDGRRCKVNALTRAWLPFDMDGNLMDGDFALLLKFFSSLSCIAYETASSATNSRRARFIVQADTVIDEVQARALGLLIQGQAPVAADVWDKCVHGAAQPLYLPPVGNAVLRFDGVILDVVAAMREVPPPKRTTLLPRPKLRQAPNAYGFFERNGLLIGSAHGGSHDVVCPWADGHTDGDTSGSVYFQPGAENGGWGGFKCQHHSCSERNIKSIFRLLQGDAS